jgi:hypothetical protein
MTQVYDGPMLLFGQTLYAVSMLIRFVRLYTSLGRNRPSFAIDLAVVHCLGVILGYFFGVLSYEFSILIFFALFKRNAFIAAFCALMLLRGLDATLLLLLSLCVMSYENIRIMLFCLSMLLLGIGFVFFSLETVIRRVEKKILAYPRKIAGDVGMLKLINAARGQIALLSWQRPGSLTLLVFLTLGGWFVEWLAFFCLSPAVEQALADMLGRVMGSFRFTMKADANSSLEALQPGAWCLLAFMTTIWLASWLRRIFTERARP